MTITTDNVRGRTFAAIPGFTEALTAAENARRAYGSTGPAKRYPIAVQALYERVADLLANSEPVPADVAADAAQAEVDDRAAELRDLAIRKAGVPVSEVRSQYIGSHSDLAFAHLSNELADTIDAVRALAPKLTGVSTAAQAITAGTESTDAWRELADLVDAYDQIRAVQLDILREVATDRTRSELLTTCLYADSIDVHPHYVSRRLTSASTSYRDSPASKSYTAWLRDVQPTWEQDPESWWPKGISREEHLLTIAEGTYPWIPDLGTYRAAAKAAGLATAAVTIAIPIAQQEARADYYRLTGIDTDADLTVSATPPVSTRAMQGDTKALQRLRANAGFAAENRARSAAWNAGRD
ncbi:hypothetical protein HQQ80_06970 [Microbacteriaceae bacterium VKM Ac-2855]|nr:hypothetical protein [Microbacteriaceae bacterium VKM Ac-2855]